MVSSRQCAQVVHRRAEQRVPQIEETGPERRAVGRGVEAGRRGKPLERPHEHGELEIDGGDAVRAGANAGPVENRTPLDELARSGPGVPRATFSQLGLELEQVLRERLLETGERGLDAIGCASQGGLPGARSRRNGISPPPSLEEPAERERGSLACAAAARQTTRGELARGIASMTDCQPCRQTSITTGSTIGRRRVRS